MKETMTPIEMQMALEALQRQTKVGATAANLMDAGGAALTYVDDLVSPAAKKLQLSLLQAGGGVGTGAGGFGSKVMRMAADPRALGALKVGTGLSAVGGVLGAADVIAGNDSLANKAMDATAMGIGGFLGAPGGPVGIAAGAGIGKALSDGTQWLFGDKKTPEQRQMELALAQLQRGGMV